MISTSSSIHILLYLIFLTLGKSGFLFSCLTVYTQGVFQFTCLPWHICFLIKTLDLSGTFQSCLHNQPTSLMVHLLLQGKLCALEMPIPIPTPTHKPRDFAGFLISCPLAHSRKLLPSITGKVYIEWGCRMR